MKIRLFLLVILSGLWTIDAIATHNRAGEISYVQTGPLTIEATITTYTKASSSQADQDSLTLCWGDGTCESVLRNNGPMQGGLFKGQIIGNNTKINTYTASHTYPGASRYTLSMNDPNRNAGVLNVNPPNSDLVRFHLETTFTLLNQQFQGFNSSPVLLQPPIDFGCVDKRFIHNPNAFETEGDSLSYHLIVPLQDVGSNVPNYTFPDDIGSDVDNELTLDPVTGDLVWDTPKIPGEYNIAMIIVEYREGVAVDTMIRDMQIFIEDCDNEPPIVETVDEICIEAGQTLSFDVTVTDPDVDDMVSVSATGGPLIIAGSQATFTAPTGYQDDPLIGTFEWTPSCDQVSDQPYTMVFKGTDNFRDTTGVSTLKSVRIKVVAPAPDDITINQASLDSITVTWAKPYSCEITMDDYFRGFSVWRRLGSNQFPIDSCENGLAGRGYTRVEFATLEMRNGRYVFVDTDIQKGRTYCYRLIGDFARLTAAGNPYNFVESLPSDEVCVQIGRDLPLVTNVSVINTDIATGTIEVRWTKPLAVELDTIANPGPYRYQLMRSDGKGSNAFMDVPSTSFSSPTFAGLVDTFFLDQNLNTAETAYRYQVAFYTQGSTSPFGTSDPATSIFLNVNPTDRTNVLTWCSEVTWQNYEFEVYRVDMSGTLDLIGTTVDTTFRDIGLTNGDEYCYQIRSVGTYGLDGIQDPLFNWSQEDCGVPFDNVPPCAPELDVVNNCDQVDPGTPAEDIINSLTWTNPADDCPDSDDTQSFNIHFSGVETGDVSAFQLIDNITSLTYDHVAIQTGGGCYFVTAIDANGNESDPSIIACIENCPDYTLPNTFTPNQDGSNDLFIPYPYRYIDQIEMKVYNQWGNLVFETTDPDINWDGRDLNGNELTLSCEL